MAIENDLTIIPMVNKIDLPNAEPERVAEELSRSSAQPDEVLRSRPRPGTGIERVLQAIVDRMPPPEGDPQAPLRALIFDSNTTPTRASSAFVRVVDGPLPPGDTACAMAQGKRFDVEELGFFRPNLRPPKAWRPAKSATSRPGSRTSRELRVGDTLTLRRTRPPSALPGYQDGEADGLRRALPGRLRPYPLLRDALEKLKLNDAALSYEPETLAALGFGFRCGFLGLLHMDIVQERLEREYDLDLMFTAPSVEYQVQDLKDGLARDAQPGPDAGLAQRHVAPRSLCGRR